MAGDGFTFVGRKIKQNETKCPTCSTGSDPLCWYWIWEKKDHCNKCGKAKPTKKPVLFSSTKPGKALAAKSSTPPEASAGKKDPKVEAEVKKLRAENQKLKKAAAAVEPDSDGEGDAMQEDGPDEPTAEGLEAEIAAIKADRKLIHGKPRFARRDEELKKELEDAESALSRMQDPGGRQRLARIEKKHKEVMASLRKAAIKKLEAQEEEDQLRDQANLCQIEMEKVRSEQRLAATTTAAGPPTPIDMVASCTSMQQSLGALFNTPGLPDVVSETKAAAEVAFSEMSALATKLAGFEATVRAAMEAAKGTTPAAAAPEVSKEEKPAGEKAVAVEEGEDGKGGGACTTQAERSGSTSHKAHPPQPNLKQQTVISTIKKTKKPAQRVAAMSDASLLAGRNWADLTEDCTAD